jgi:hypothetical protein
MDKTPTLKLIEFKHAACSNCGAWTKTPGSMQLQPGAAAAGECRRHPPTPFMVQIVNKLDLIPKPVTAIQSAYPTTSGDQWCLDHIPLAECDPPPEPSGKN